MKIDLPHETRTFYQSDNHEQHMVTEKEGQVEIRAAKGPRPGGPEAELSAAHKLIAAWNLNYPDDGDVWQPPTANLDETADPRWDAQTLRMATGERALIQIVTADIDSHRWKYIQAEVADGQSYGEDDIPEQGPALRVLRAFHKKTNRSKYFKEGIILLLDAQSVPEAWLGRSMISEVRTLVPDSDWDQVWIVGADPEAVFRLDQA